MRWATQVGHVSVKDLRQARWAVAAFVLVVAFTARGWLTGDALGPYSTSPNSEVLGMRALSSAWLPFGIVVLGGMLAASLLQLDSPTRADSFWPTRPLSPSAVLGAKIALVVAALVLPPVIGGFVALRSLDASRATVVTLLADAGLSYGEWLLAVMVIASLTDDLRTCISVFLAIAISLAALSDAEWFVVAPWLLTSVAVAGAVAGVVFLVFLYRRRHDRRLGTWAVAIATSLCLIVVSFREPFVRGIVVPEVRTGPSLEIEPVDSAAQSAWVKSGPIETHIRLAAPSGGERFDFQLDSAVVRSRSGSVARSVARGEPIIVGRTLPPVGRPVRWIIDESASQSPTTLAINAADVNWQVLSQHINSLAVWGKVTASRPHVLASVPLRVGETRTTDGWRVSIYGVAHDPRAANVWVHVSAVHRPGAPQLDPALGLMSGLQFAIVNDRLGEAMLLGNPGGSSSESGSMVLPWIGVSTVFQGLTTRPADAIPRDDAWYAGARLIVVEWMPVGSYRTTVQAALP